MSFIDQLKQDVNRYLDRVQVKKLAHTVALIAREREDLKTWTDKELQLSTIALKEDIGKGRPLDELIIPAFAVVNEAARRLLHKYPYDVQILAGLVIHSGKVAEMKAGEGKTLTETMPVYLNALEGRGVHVITTNDYLAERDAKEMGQLYKFLGLSSGYVTSEMKNDERRKAYAADITYVTNQEVGFDFLRDNLVYSRKERVLRPKDPLYFGIVDEIDSILIDESRTPLIIAEPVAEERQFYNLFTKIANKLEEEKDYTVDYKNKTLALTNDGLDEVERMLGTPMFSKENPMYVFYLDVCLKARVLFEKDRDYIVTKDGVEIVDEFTGRVLPGRRFTDGVHQAIEAKEKVKVKEADRTQAAITFQNFFPMYKKLSGMSGTVMGARDEFSQVYKLEVVQIPTNRPMARNDHNDLFFKTKKGKFLGLIKKVRQIQGRGQPLLIGARNVETAHEVARLLDGQNLPYQLLTAQDNRAEAQKIIQAGQENMITIATNMAGRGTDIVLGEGVPQRGGLFVFGTERHESRRIDDQLVGRAGRQGDPGESQFLISMEDEIMQLFGSERIIDTMEQYDIPEDEYISGPSLDRAFRKAQEFVESKNYDSRVYLYKYDRVVNYQRSQLYHLRERLLENEPEFTEFTRQAIRNSVATAFMLGDPEAICKELQDVFYIDIDPKEIKQALLGGDAKSQQQLEEKFTNFLTQAAGKLKGIPEVHAASQQLVLEVIDSNWSTHLELMDVLKEEANLFSYASEDPLIDFIKDSTTLYQHMCDTISRQFLKYLFLHITQVGLLK